jgi:dihydroneopterin aldolase
VRIELRGLTLHGFHGVLAEEREQGQRFLVDVTVEPLDARSGETDRIEDAVDYRDIVAVVREISDGRAFHLLEALATAIAGELVGRLPLAHAVVTVRKPDVTLALPVDEASVTVERHAPTESA